MSLAQRALEKGNLGHAQDPLELHRPMAGETGVRGFEWPYLLEASQHRRAVRLSGHGSEIWSVVFAPDGKPVAAAGDGRTVKLWNLATRREVATLLPTMRQSWI